MPGMKARLSPKIQILMLDQAAVLGHHRYGDFYGFAMVVHVLMVYRDGYVVDPSFISSREATLPSVNNLKRCFNPLSENYVVENTE